MRTVSNRASSTPLSFPLLGLLAGLLVCVADADELAAGGAAPDQENSASPPAAADQTFDAGAIPVIETAELLAYLAGRGGFTLLDARSPEEYAIGHVHAAVNMPHDAVEQHLEALPEDRDVPLVTYCKTGKRAVMLAERLRELGYRDVRVLGPRQMFWSDTAPMFNCGAPAPPAPDFLPASS